MADYDGDGVCDLAVWRARAGVLLIHRSRDQKDESWTDAALRDGATLAVGDYDGDGQADYAVWHAARGWRMRPQP